MRGTSARRCGARGLISSKTDWIASIGFSTKSASDQIRTDAFTPGARSTRKHIGFDTLQARGFAADGGEIAFDA